MEGLCSSTVEPLPTYQPPTFKTILLKGKVGLSTMVGLAQYETQMSHPIRLLKVELTKEGGCMYLAQPAFICHRFQTTSQTMLQGQSLCITVTNLELYLS
jgi:hypothetical protein